MQIEEITQVTDEIVAAFARLIPQLAPGTLSPTWAELAEVVASPATRLLVARNPQCGGAIVGALTLVIFRIPTGRCAWIEDVVVDATTRGQGIGEALCRAALERAATAGAATVDLTSRPTREAANRLYQRIGFQKRETNVYRYDLSLKEVAMTRFLLWLSVGLLLLCAVPGFGIWAAGSAARVFEPTRTPAYFVWLPILFRDASAAPTPFPTAIVSPTPTATPSASPTPEETPTATPSASPAPEETPTATPSASPTPEETPTATPTRTPTSTATPTPTVTPSCSLTNVTGTYYSTITNMVGYGCPINPVPPAPSDIGVIQTGAALLFRTGIGDGTGAINTTTGQFTVVGTLSSAGGCPILSTCTNTTSGTFTIGQSPMSFAGTGRIDITGLIRCYVTYDMVGDRTSCTAP